MSRKRLEEYWWFQAGPFPVVGVLLGFIVLCVAALMWLLGVR